MPFVQLNSVTAPWLAVMQGLAGASPEAYWGATDSDELYKVREQLKATASEWRAHYAEPFSASFRAPYWVLHAYSHWWRAWLALRTGWDAAEYDERFPAGMNFRRYLGAWLHSVGLSLGMTQRDCDAVHQMTGVAIRPHELLPPGFTDFRHCTVAEDPPPLDEVLQAAARSKA